MNNNFKSNSNEFFNNDILFENSWKSISLSQINEIVPDEFPGKKDFIKFYLTTNGGVFSKGAYIYPDNFYEASNKDYYSIEIGSFFHIPLIEDEEDSDYTTSIERAKDRRIDYSEEFEDFVLFHIPFADNHADNDFWIDIQTGEIKYMDYEVSYDPENAIIVAPSFLDFCKHIQAKLK
ncbi:SMI1/KNR4 family protein [Lysinibacillus irui]|uniref:SMI1/KNR4 family protein n=1 Tax=Lysinibacillus irui TaxID=2998077 RepID=A0ABU5NKH6_9BACI|nr:MULTISPECIES: SMI1/KNR4 family protein [Lysinibacillus]MEA0554827.1 SMI1/KNR4 family protein [Lysinibacillus irui]MEA0976542.1 SMI1/KNR4 family protein [Lysinibacillus irui]MEA1042696.1 SMI1/KNR4 family protein [Lysinibacillus irui]WBF54551.1 SMI1/KNR4 family protein [Lysinibacillus sp. JK80]